MIKTKEPTQEKKRFSIDLKEAMKNVTVPTSNAWFNLFWQVSLTLVITGTALFFVDYFFLHGVLFVQSLLPTLQTHWAATIFFSVFTVLMLLSTVSILAQKGSGASLSSMLGSTTQAADITGSMGNIVAKISTISMTLTVILAFFSPIFAKGF